MVFVCQASGQLLIFAHVGEGVSWAQIILPNTQRLFRSSSKKGAPRARPLRSMFRSDMGGIGGRGIKIRNIELSLAEALELRAPPTRLPFRVCICAWAQQPQFPQFGNLHARTRSTCVSPQQYSSLRSRIPRTRSSAKPCVIPAPSLTHIGSPLLHVFDTPPSGLWLLLGLMLE